MASTEPASFDALATSSEHLGRSNVCLYLVPEFKKVVEVAEVTLAPVRPLQRQAFDIHVLPV